MRVPGFAVSGHLAVLQQRAVLGQLPSLRKRDGDAFCGSPLPSSRGFCLPHSPASESLGRGQGPVGRLAVLAAVQPPGS